MNFFRLFLVNSLFFFSFSANADSPVKELEESLVKWQAAKEKCEDSYSYQVTTSSMTGFRTVTTISVEKGKVVSRTYEEMNPGGPIPLAPAPGKENPAPKTGYVETGEGVGKEKKGAPPLTLDELYAKAMEVVKNPVAAHEKLYAKYDDAGLLIHCFKIDTRIMDDAPMAGVAITNLKLK